MRRQKLILLVLGLLVGGVGGICFWWQWDSDSRQFIPPVPNFIDSGSDKKKGEQILAEYKEQFEAHLEEHGNPMFALFSEIKFLDYSSLGIRPDDTVADLGAGVGTLAMSMLYQRIPFAKLYSLDINPYSLKFLDYALERHPWEHPERVETVNSLRTDVTLPADSVEILFIVEVPAIYFALTQSGDYIASPAALADMKRLFATIDKALTADGELHFIYPVTTPTSGECNPEELISALAEIGFDHVATRRLLLGVDNYYLVFRPPESTAPPGPRPGWNPTARSLP